MRIDKQLPLSNQPKWALDFLTKTFYACAVDLIAMIMVRRQVIVLHPDTDKSKEMLKFCKDNKVEEMSAELRI